MLILHEYFDYARYKLKDNPLRKDYNKKVRGDFSVWWKQAVPEEYWDDAERMERVRTLCKFVKLSYRVEDLRNPYGLYLREIDKPKNKRKAHKTIKINFGI